MKLYLNFTSVETLIEDDEATFEDAKSDAQQLIGDWKERLTMTKDPIWLGVNEGGEIRCLFEIETSPVTGIKELDENFKYISEDMGRNLGTSLNVFDFTPSSPCCTQAYDNGEYDTGVINMGDESGEYAKYTEIVRKEWGIEL